MANTELPLNNLYNRSLPLFSKDGAVIRKAPPTEYFLGTLQKPFNKNAILCWRRCGKKGTLLHCWWECKLVQPLWRTAWSFLKKLKIELPYDPAIPLLGIYLEYSQYFVVTVNGLMWKDTCTPMFIAVLSTIAKTWKQPKWSLTDEWIKSGTYIQRNITQP